MFVPSIFVRSNSSSSSFFWWEMKRGSWKSFSFDGVLFIKSKFMMNPGSATFYFFFFLFFLFFFEADPFPFFFGVNFYTYFSSDLSYNQISSCVTYSYSFISLTFLVYCSSLSFEILSESFSKVSFGREGIISSLISSCGICCFGDFSIFSCVFT